MRGYFPSRKNRRQISFESTFERDLFYLLELDPDVVCYEEQPITVQLEWDGVQFTYTPDVCVVLRSLDVPIYYEVKPSIEDFPGNKKKAMDCWASIHDVKFEVIDASHIRSGIALERAKFLYPYLRFNPGAATIDLILSKIGRGRRIISELVNETGCRLGEIYHLVALGILAVDGMPGIKSEITLGEISL